MPHPRLLFDTLPAALYAIGDIHGCLEQYRELEAKIVEDSGAFEGDKWIVTLGDHIDRGPASAGVIAAMLAPPPLGFRRLALLGNHERMLLDFLVEPLEHSYWLEEGGLETLLSYGLDVKAAARTDAPGLADIARRLLPPEHLAWIASLPVMITLPGWVLVHAGIRPGVPLAAQTDHDLVWIREPFLSLQRPLPRGASSTATHRPNCR